MSSKVSNMNEKNSQIIVNRILGLCRQRGLNVHQLSVMSGVSHSTLKNLVGRKTFNPRIKTLHRIATAFNMTVAEFLDFEELNNFSFDDDEEE